MFGTIKGLIPEPRQAEQPRHYIGRHRYVEPPATPHLPAQPSATESETDAPTRELASAVMSSATASPDPEAESRP